MIIARPSSQSVARLSLREDERGVSAVEFAMLLPLMLTLYLGGVEVSQGVSIDRKVTLTARTVADLVAQVSSINTTGLNSRARGLDRRAVALSGRRRPRSRFR